MNMTEEQFQALENWINRVAIAQIGERLYKNQRSIEKVNESALKAQNRARKAFGL